MRIGKLAASGTLFLLIGTVAASAGAADDPASGTWTVNLTKSKYSPGPAPKSTTVTIKIENNTEMYESQGTDASGNPIHGSFTAKLDGTDAPVSGIAYADTVSTKRSSPTHFVAMLKKGGTVMMTVHVVIAADGKSRTVTYSGKDEKGEAEHDVVFYDKQ
jgi:hypothetical protein